MNSPSHQEKGNVLFLILIAVALFAALSYAVTSSTRTGEQDSSRESLAMKYSIIMQHASVVRSSILRMQVMKGITLTDIVFVKNPMNLTEGPCITGSNCLFAAENGWGVPIPVPTGISSFNFYIYGSLDLMGSAAVEPVLILLGPTQDFCDYVHEKEGLPAINIVSPPVMQRVIAQCASAWPLGTGFFYVLIEQ